MKVAGIFKGDDPCKVDRVTQFDQFLGLGVRSRKAVKNSPKTPRKWLQVRQSIGPAFPLMHDNIQLESCSQIELFLKKGGLAIFDLCIGEKEFLASEGNSASGRRGFTIRSGPAGEAMVIKSTLSEGNDLGMLGELFQLLDG